MLNIRKLNENTIKINLLKTFYTNSNLPIQLVVWTMEYGLYMEYGPVIPTSPPAFILLFGRKRQ